jgi:hypothetical protein
MITVLLQYSVVGTTGAGSVNQCKCHHQQLGALQCQPDCRNSGEGLQRMGICISSRNYVLH